MRRPSKADVISLGMLSIPQLICLAVFWPGELQWDHIVTIAGLSSGAPDQWHSIIWGYIAEPIIMNFGYGWYGLMQIIIQVALEYWCLTALRRNGLYDDKMEIVLSLVYGLSPCFLMYGLLWGTDTLFAVLMMALATMMVLTVRTYGSYLDDGGSRLALIFILIMMTQFRKNAVLVPLILYPIIMIRYKNVRMRILRDLIAVIGVDLLLSLGLSLAGVTASPPQEMLSIPAQQVGLAAREHGDVAPWAREEFEKFRPWSKWASQYQPPDADNLKNGLNHDLTGFARAWLDTGMRNPGIYVRAWMLVEYPYWQVTTDVIHDLQVDHISQDFNDYTTWIVDGREEPQEGVICNVDRSKCYTDPMITSRLILHHTSRQVWLNQIYSVIENAHIPVLTDLFTLVFFDSALPLWSTILSLIIALRRRRCADWLVVWTAPALIVLTLLVFSPIALFRYALQVIWSLPVLWTWTWKSVWRRS